MATLHELSLAAGVFFTGLFLLQYYRYQQQINKEEVMDKFLKD